MANNTHGLINTTRCTCWDVDAYNLVGVATTDLDNGVAVTLGEIANTSGAIDGYQFAVTPATAASVGVCVVRTPEVGTDLCMNIMYDPRTFYNEAGRPLHLCRLNPGVDYIEVDKNCFVGGTAPTAAQRYVTIGANGKYAPATTAPTAGCYFSVVGTHYMSVGQEIVGTWVLRCERN